MISRYHPDTLADVNHLRRSTALAKYRRKVDRCEKLLVSARYLILEMLGAGQTLSDRRLLNDIEEEIRRRK